MIHEWNIKRAEQALKCKCAPKFRLQGAGCLDDVYVISCKNKKKLIRCIMYCDGQISDLRLLRLMISYRTAALVFISSHICHVFCINFETP